MKSSPVKIWNAHEEGEWKENEVINDNGLWLDVWCDNKNGVKFGYFKNWMIG